MIKENEQPDNNLNQLGNWQGVGWDVLLYLNNTGWAKVSDGDV